MSIGETPVANGQSTENGQPSKPEDQQQKPESVMGVCGSTGGDDRDDRDGPHSGPFQPEPERPVRDEDLLNVGSQFNS
ncbi:uncharacterized protein TRUGW13939_01271 [Talaromyces rugulosus]|uniref:Uncharacterized protein n=1 Tax=Talaromyces rugulosus TaxID=121627 RepID=A0A7H8QJS2_TALRU|nr:uncharacterized protein TRUGW13939_01271 [Talaromyces rugulosus]QKX54187.1 hypothetical protein TRUGW13939_01271 [Talaromyces rugulosus]